MRSAGPSRGIGSLVLAALFGTVPLWSSACLHDSVPLEPALVLPPTPPASIPPMPGPAPVAAPDASIPLPPPTTMVGAGAAGMSAPPSATPGVTAGIGGAPAPTSGPADPQCDLRGGWLQQQVTRNTALGAVQLATAWSYHRFEQEGDRIRVVQSLDCGLAVRGTADVSLADATLEAFATRSPHATGVQGTFTRSADGKSCSLSLDRSYNIRGANRERFLTAVWKVGDPPKPLSEFRLPVGAADGMEDWDGDGHEGITLLTGLGDRYIAQIDYFSIKGNVPLGAQQFGGEGVLIVDHDAREAISSETSLLLQATGVPTPPGHAFMARVDGEFALPQGERPTLEACRQVQTLSIKKFGDPPRP